MIKGISNFDLDIQKRVLEIYQNQMISFGGFVKGNELVEVFKKDGYVCVRFQNGDWYHYELSLGTWF